jgi:hypothetical protein
LKQQQPHWSASDAGPSLTATPRTGKTPEELSSLTSSLASDTAKRRRKLESAVEETAELLRSRSANTDFLQMFMMQMQSDREERKAEREEQRAEREAREAQWRRDKEAREAERREERAEREERDRKEREQRHQELIAMFMSRK